MRLLVHTLLTLMIAGILGGLAMYHLHVTRTESGYAEAREEVSRFQQQVHLQSALASADGQETAAPESIEPAWFDGNLPRNPLLGPEHPWVEIAGPEHRNLVHPPDLAAVDETSAAFWYNPHNGLVRARVPVGISDAETLRRYNEINDCNVTSLFPPR